MMTSGGSHSTGSRVRAIGIPVVVLAVLGLLLYKIIGGPQPTDQDQLISILDDIRAGVARQDVGQTMSHTSAAFEVSGLNRQQARLEVAQFYHVHATSSLVLRQPQIQINGTQATVQVYAQLMASPMNAGGAVNPAAGGAAGQGPPSSVYQGVVTLQFQRVDTRRFGIFPSYEWRLVKGDVPNMESVEGY